MSKNMPTEDREMQLCRGFGHLGAESLTDRQKAVLFMKTFHPEKSDKEIREMLKDED